MDRGPARPTAHLNLILKPVGWQRVVTLARSRPSKRTCATASDFGKISPKMSVTVVIATVA